MPGPDVGHPDPEVQLDALALQDLCDIAVGRLGERPQQHVAEVDEVHARRRDREVVELDGHRVADHVGERAGRLDAGRAAADHDEVQRAAVEQRGVAVGSLEQAEDPRAQARGVVVAVEREGVLLGARRAEEVRDRAGGHDDRIAGQGLSLGHRHGSPGGVDGGDVAELDVDVRVLPEQLAHLEHDVARGDLAGRDLVQQRLELVVVVAVDERHAHVLVVGQAPGAREAGHARAHDDDVALAVGPAHAIAALRTVAPSRSLIRSPTRSALAIAVSAGLTAPMLGKKLVSTT